MEWSTFVSLSGRLAGRPITHHWACRYATSWLFAHGGIMGMPMALTRAPGILRMQELCNHKADSLQIKFTGTVLACRYAMSWSFACGGIMGMPIGMIRAPGILRMLELRNYWAESLKIKFIGIVLACICATPWSLAYVGIMSMPMGMIMAHGILRTPELHNHWADSFQIKVIGIVLTGRCATSWSSSYGGIMGKPIGVIRAPGILRTLEFRNQWADSLQIKFFGTVLVCRHATSRSFAHQDLMGVKHTRGTLFTGQGTFQWSACFERNLELKKS